MTAFACVLERKVARRVAKEKIEDQLNYIVGRTVSGTRKSWSCVQHSINGPVSVNNYWLYKVKLNFSRSGKPITDSDATQELNQLCKFMYESCNNVKFKPAWEMKEVNPDWLESYNFCTSSENQEVEADDIVDFDQALTIEDIDIPEVLVNGSDIEIENHSAFRGIFGRAKHIRIIASSLKRMKDTGGKKRNHLLLWGLPGCAKSHIMNGWMKVLGKGGYLSINANSATKAGIERIFLNRLTQTGCPPVFFVEEIEKTSEAILTVWLSILDDRAEVRKVTHHNQIKSEANVLCIATANDKFLFDRLHGGRTGSPGALSSRFTKQLYVPRPDKEIMKRILARDIELYGGNTKWIQPCIDIANEIGTDDPRTVLSFLDGQDRLLDGSYKDDILEVFHMEKSDVIEESCINAA